jgi:hypothetical protein
MKAAIDRASEAIETAEIMFVDEMGVALDLSSAAKMVLTVRIAAAIRAAVAAERKRLISVQGVSRLSAALRRAAANIPAPMIRPLRFGSR